MAGSGMPGVMDAGPFRGCPDGSRFRSKRAITGIPSEARNEGAESWLPRSPQ